MLADSPYLDPYEAAAAAADQTDKALGSVISKLIQYALDKQVVREELGETADEDTIEELECHLRLLEKEERSWQRILSGLQSRLKAGAAI